MWRVKKLHVVSESMIFRVSGYNMESIHKATGIIVRSHDFTTHSYFCTLFVIVLYYMLTNKTFSLKKTSNQDCLTYILVKVYN